jgi:hypothetical protein
MKELDKTRKWNRLGPAGQVFQCHLGRCKFDEHEGIYDSDTRRVFSAKHRLLCGN